jgi:hypothetical protein
MNPPPPFLSLDRPSKVSPGSRPPPSPPPAPQLLGPEPSTEPAFGPEWAEPSGSLQHEARISWAPCQPDRGTARSAHRLGPLSVRLRACQSGCPCRPRPAGAAHGPVSSISLSSWLKWCSACSTFLSSSCGGGGGGPGGAGPKAAGAMGEGADAAAAAAAGGPRGPPSSRGHDPMRAGPRRRQVVGARALTLTWPYCHTMSPNSGPHSRYASS